MQIFTTENLSGNDRITYWNEVICDYLLDVNTRFDVSKESLVHFNGTLVRHDADRLTLLDVRSREPFTVSRDLQRTAQAEDEFAMLNVQVAGTTTINQAGRTACLTPGEMVLYDSRMPHHGWGRSDGGVRSLLLRIPRGEIIHRIPYLQAVSTVPLASHKTLTRLVFDMLLSLRRQLQTGETEVDAGLSEALLDTIAAAASSSFRDTDDHFSGSSQALLHRVKSYIDRHLFSAELSPQRIAQAHKVTARYLNKLFAREDTSITRWICKRRLQKCAELLSSQVGRCGNIDEIAYQCGFNSLPYFYRKFRQHYDCSPREYRLKKGRDNLSHSTYSLG